MTQTQIIIKQLQIFARRRACAINGAFQAADPARVKKAGIDFVRIIEAPVQQAASQAVTGVGKLLDDMRRFSEKHAGLFDDWFCSVW